MLSFTDIQPATERFHDVAWMQACFSEHECLGQVYEGGGGGAVKLMLTLVLRPLGGFHGIG